MIFRPFFVPPKVFCVFFVFWFGFCLFLFDGFIIAVKKAPNHQQCRCPLMLKRHGGTLVLIISKKVCRNTEEMPEKILTKATRDLFLGQAVLNSTWLLCSFSVSRSVFVYTERASGNKLPLTAEFSVPRSVLVQTERLSGKIGSQAKKNDRITGRCSLCFVFCLT